jgi:lipopolysaccharide/colanic/teichoic acid biosynthesis glycosyltransferase
MYEYENDKKVQLNESSTSDVPSENLKKFEDALGSITAWWVLPLIILIIILVIYALYKIIF